MTDLADPPALEGTVDDPDEAGPAGALPGRAAQLVGR